MVRCGIYNTLPLHLAPHHILHCIISSTSNAISDIILSHTTFHITPSYHIAHFASQQQLAAHCYSTSQHRIQSAPYRPHYVSHHISHCTPFHITDVPHSMYSMPYSDHTIYWPHHLCIAPPHNASHHILHNIALHSTCSTSCIIPPHL